MTLELDYFEGQQNLEPGTRRGSDKILPEILNDIEASGIALPVDTDTQRAVFQSAELTGTGASQDVAHGLGVVPSAVLVSVTDDNNAAFTIAEGVHDATNVKVTVTLNAKFKVLAFS